MSEQFEMYDDPFKMLILLVKMAADQKGMQLDFANVPKIETDTFLLENSKFVYKKDGTIIEWFQFLGRDINCSRDLSRSEYNKMFVDCMHSLFFS